MNIETALKLAKPYVGSLAKDPGRRPVLKTALVTEDHVIATNSHILIRITHDDLITEPYLHKYREYDELFGYEVSNYPTGVHRLIPTIDYNYTSGQLATKEMIEAIEGAAMVSKINTKVLKLEKPQHVILSSEKMVVPNTVPSSFETGGYAYNFSDNPLPIKEKTAYNPEYLKMIFKTFKAAGEKTIDSHWRNNMAAWYLTSGPIEVIVLPVSIGKGEN